MMPLIYRVYHFPLCPFSRKLRAVLAEKGITFQLVIEKAWERRPEFLSINPACTTPTVHYKQDKILHGNYALFEFFEDSYPEVNLIGKDPELRANVRSICEWFDVKFYNEVTKYIFLEKVIKLITHAGAPNSEAIRVASNNLNYHLKYIAYLLRHNKYLCADYLTLADFAAAAQISVLDYLNYISWDKKDRVKEWYALIKSRPSFRPILHDIVQPISPPSHYSNPDF